MKNEPSESMSVSNRMCAHFMPESAEPVNEYRGVRNRSNNNYGEPCRQP